MLPEPDAPPSGRTRNPRIDQFDPRILKSGNQLHERIDVGSDDAIAGFHALNGGNGKVCQIGHLPLIYIQERAGGPELVGRDHERRFSQSWPNMLTLYKYHFQPSIYLYSISETRPIVFAGPTITAQDARRDYREARLQTVGFLADRMVMVVWTPREEARHVISMRKCNDREKTIYQERFDQG
jgi:uncharacterized DUF497 family protein